MHLDQSYWFVAAQPDDACLHVDETQYLNANMSIHLKHLIELAHLEQHGAVKMASLELPPTCYVMVDMRSRPGVLNSQKVFRYST